MAIQIIPAIKDDIQAIAKLEDESYKHGYFKALQIGESLFSDANNKVFAAKDDEKKDKLIGYVEISLKDIDAKIGFLAVSKEYRRSGIGKRLVEKAIDWAEDEECEKISLEVQADNVAAIMLYSKLGFIAVKTYEKQSNGKTVKMTVMEKTL